MVQHTLQSYAFVRFFMVLFTISLLFGLFGCQPAADPTEIVFAVGEDDGGTLQPLIDQFNDMHEGKINVTLKKGARLSNEFYEEAVVDLENNAIDVLSSDVIWTPALAEQGLIKNISQQFFKDYQPQDFIDAAMESVSYHFNVWGIPWYTDAGILYYRKDLLEASGFEYPPTTWKDLISYSKKIMEDSGTPAGYVFQGANYEGGVTNACEFIWNAGGDILFGDLPVSGSFEDARLDPEIITLNSKASRKGLQHLQLLANSGILPSNIQDFKEREAGEAFRKGEAAFMRSWASSYWVLLADDSDVGLENVGLTPLPTSDPGATAYSCLGGWNLMINAKIDPQKEAAAWDFVRFMSSTESQKYRALNGGILPTLRHLYKDEEFLKDAPVANFARQVLPVSKERPRSPHYMEMSPAIGSVYAKVLSGEMNPDQAIEALTDQLELILSRKEELAKE